MLNLFSEFKKTNFKGGFFKFNLNLLYTDPREVDLKFRAPRKIDNRDMCLLTDNQGDSPYCAAYSTAGYIEFQNWKTLHYPSQIDSVQIYKKAKELENNNADGTSFEYTVDAANKLNLIKGKFSIVKSEVLSIKFAIHQFGVCLAGFLITDEWNYVSKKSGIISKNSKPQILAGHAVILTGYDDTGVYIQNSWGDSWGVHGFAILSWDQCIDQLLYGAVIEN